MLPVDITDPDGTILVRPGIVLALFANRPFADVRSAMHDALEEWLRMVPAKDVSWAVIGSSATTFKPVTDRTFEQCRSILSKRQSAESTTSIRLLGPEKYNPAYGFTAVGPETLDVDSNEDCLLEIKLPWRISEDPGPDYLVDYAVRTASMLSFDSGYLSPALNWGKDSRRIEAGSAMMGIGMRHPGLDIHFNAATRLELGRLIRGARWVTFLGPHSIDALGGREALLRKLPSEVDTIQAGEGVALRVSQQPAVGDVNRHDDLPLLKAVARVLEPVTCHDDNLLRTALFDEDSEDAYDRWEGRLLA